MVMLRFRSLNGARLVLADECARSFAHDIGLVMLNDGTGLSRAAKPASEASAPLTVCCLFSGKMGKANGREAVFVTDRWRTPGGVGGNCFCALRLAGSGVE